LVELVLNKTISFSDLISGLFAQNFIEEIADQTKLLQKIKIKLKNSPNPVIELKELLEKLKINSQHTPHQLTEVAI
jgi:hypothetical protein